MNTWISFASFSDELHKIAEAGKIPLEKAERKIFNALMRGAPVKVVIDPQAAMVGGGYFDTDKKHIALAEKDYRVLAHELGHADIDKHVLSRVLQNKFVRMASNLGTPLAAVGASVLLAKGKKWGLLLPAAVAAPTLINEAMASSKGDRILKSTKATDEQQKAYRSLVSKGFASYAALPAIMTGAALAGHAINKLASK